MSVTLAVPFRPPLVHINTAIHDHEYTLPPCSYNYGHAGHKYTPPPCRDARVYYNTTTAMHDNEQTPPPG